MRTTHAVRASVIQFRVGTLGVRGMSSTTQEWRQRQARDPFVRAAVAQGFRSRAAFKLMALNEKYRILRPGNVVVDLGAAPGGWSQVAAQAVRSRTSLPTRVGGASGTAERINHVTLADDVAAPASMQHVVAQSAVRVSALTAFRAEPTLAKLSTLPAQPRVPEKLGTGSHHSAPSMQPLPSEATPGGRVVAVDLSYMPAVPGVAFLRGDFQRPDVQAQVQSAAGGDVDVVLSDLSHSFTGDGHTDHLRQMSLAWCALAFTARVLRRRGHMLVKVRYGEEYALFRAAVKRMFVRMVEAKPPASRSDSAESYIIGFDIHSSPGSQERSKDQLTAAEREALSRLGVQW